MMIEYSYYLVIFNKNLDIFEDLSREELDLLLQNNINYIKAVHKVVKGSDIKRHIYLYEKYMYDEYNYDPDKLIEDNKKLDKDRYGDNPMTQYDCDIVKFLYNNYINLIFS